MRASFSSFNYLLSPLFIVMVFGASAADAKQSSKHNKKKIASVSIQTKVDTKAQKAAKKSKKKKTRTTTVTPASLMQKDMANLSDDEITRIRLIKRYQGVKSPRLDWSNGLRTLEYHYSDNLSE